MRKLLVFNMMALDGFFEGPDGNIDWHVVDEEFNQFAIDQLETVDLLIFGRITYQLMASYWPTPSAAADDPQVAALMNRTDKLVFSKTLSSAGWQNTRLVKGDAAQEISRLKSQPGKDMIIFGSAELASALLNQGLIDEYRVIINPLVLGRGRPLFKAIPAKVSLKLLSTRVFASGNVLLVYQPER